MLPLATLPAAESLGDYNDEPDILGDDEDPGEIIENDEDLGKIPGDDKDHPEHLGHGVPPEPWQTNR